MIDRQTTFPIGVYDSGIGGISVLAEIVRLLPNENYIYLADSANAPYGTKSYQQVLELSLNAARSLISRDIKALVVACNTATSVAIEEMRKEFNIPVIGMEPALKPAVETGKNGHIVVMATPLTLVEEKFVNLYNRYNDKTSIIPVPCPGLVEIIESEAEPDKIQQYLTDRFKNIKISDISAVVLGCTHYCFVKNELADVIGRQKLIVDGNAGTARHLKTTLSSCKLLNDDNKIRTHTGVDYITSGNIERIIPLCQRFLTKALNNGD